MKFDGDNLHALGAYSRKNLITLYCSSYQLKEERLAFCFGGASYANNGTALINSNNLLHTVDHIGESGQEVTRVMVDGNPVSADSGSVALNPDANMCMYQVFKKPSYEVVLLQKKSE
jgi:hypothetical protein